MRTLVLMVTLMAAVAPATPQEQGTRKDETSKKIKALQKERIATLKEVADHVNALFKSGHASFEEAAEARLLVLNAELDDAEKQSDRIAINEKIVDVMKKYEEVADSMVKVGKEMRSSFLKTKARRLEAEIRLERAKLKEAKENK